MPDEDKGERLMETKELLSKAIEIRRAFIETRQAFREIHGHGGVISTENIDGIHVTEKLLFVIPGEIKREERDSTEYPVKLSKKYAGETFFAIMKDIEEYNKFLLEE